MVTLTAANHRRKRTVKSASPRRQMTREIDQRACPRCGAVGWRLHLSDEKVTKDMATLKKLSQLAKNNPMVAGAVMGASGSIMLADRLGLIKIYVCRNCHHPFHS
jgi:predicted amidohydrolase YtcJ